MLRSKQKLPKNRIGSSKLNPLGLKVSKPTGKPATPLAKRLADKRRIFKKLPWPTRSTFVFTWRKFFIVMGSFLAVFILGIAITFAVVVRELPNPKQLSNRPIDQSTKIVDRNGNLIYNFFGDQNRTLLTADQISDNIKDATVALEDATFYEHSGFALKGISRAVVCRVTKSCVAGGGSTITQQYVKLALLNDTSQTLTRKIKDLFLAIEVEQVYSKEEILTGYLNEISYGGNIYGIEAASQSYFGKTAKDLSLAEAATLASIPQRPAYYSPYGSHLDALFARKDYTLDRMASVGMITQEEADAAKKEAPNVENPNFTKKQGLIAPHFAFYVRQQLLAFMEGDSQQAELKLDTAGYTVTTSLDLETQKLAESIVTDMGPAVVKDWGASNAALTAVDPKTGEVIAMVGSIDYTDSKSGNTNFANALLQPGSSFKPIVYATAFDKDHKHSPASITYDLQTDFGGGYIPQNYNGKFNGPVTNRNALAQSLNIPAVKNLALVGVSDAIATAEKLGISSLTAKPGDYGLSLVLGAGEVRPVEMANAYGAFSNGGIHHDLRPILKIEKDGKVIKDFTQDEGTQVIEPQVAYQITSILSDNNARTPVFGSKSKLTLADRPVAAKSGTTNSNRDGWTVGFTPQISVAVWVGNNEAGKTMKKGADGSVVAAPIWNRFMREYLKGKPVEQFARPDGLTELTVDKLSGKLPNDQSPPDQRITDIFAEWQIPKESDDVHIKVQIDKTTGKLATALTPADNIETRYYIRVHSEMPDNPNWEGPVQAWAQQNGASDKPPTETDDVHTEANRPTIKITTPKANSTAGDPITISVDAGGNSPITKVEFFINNVSIGVRTEAPWNISYPSGSLPSGSQVITATATNQLGLTRSDEVTIIKSGSDTTPPGAVSNVNITKTGGRSVHITWSNPNDADLAGVNVYMSIAANTLGNSVGSGILSGTLDVSNLPIGIVYFTFVTYDPSNNKTTSQQYPFTVTGP